MNVLGGGTEGGRRHRVAGAAGLLALAAAALGLMGQVRSERPQPSVIEAKRFVLRESSGAVRAVLGVDADGAARLVLHDRRGIRRLVLGAEAEGGAGVTVLDKDGQAARAALDIHPGGLPGITLFDPDGKTARVALDIGPDGEPGLALSDRDGRPQAILALFARAREGGGPPPGRRLGPERHHHPLSRPVSLDQHLVLQPHHRQGCRGRDPHCRPSGFARAGL